MIEDRWRQIEHLYHAALAFPVESRPLFLDGACGDDDALRAEIDSLLQFEAVSGQFLERSALEAAAQTLSATRLGLRPPDIPGYRIIRELGEGGMGVVYLAEQESPLRRLVALKLIRPGMDSRPILARFDAERQALALMDHPNIAAVFGAGSTNDGRPYFVMEFVDGVPITEFCDRAKLSTRARLDLFLQVCAAVQHAHQKGVIHRDIKPSNVLVATLDDRAVPKVIDFGTAKAIAHAADKRVTLTGQALGTLEYMSPEQAGFSADIDTTTDVYSLGVVLYELLVGALPFELATADPDGYAELRRAIRETDPPKPSSRIAWIDEAHGHPPRTRRTDAGLLARELKGDLDWVVLKALEKDRARRYATVTAFAEDIGRFLIHQPVGARPPSSAYRLRKFGRRHRTALSLTMGALLVSVVGLVSILFMYGRVERAQLDLETRTYAATIGAVDGELRAGAAGNARKRLLTIAPGQREWEWKHLFFSSDTSLATIGADAAPCQPSLFGGTEPAVVRGIIRNPAKAGSILVVRCGTLESWDLGSLTRTSSRSLSASTILAVNEGDGLVALPWRFGSPWQAQVVSRTTGKVLSVLGPLTDEPLCAGLSEDGTQVALGFPGDTFELWNVATGRRTHRLQARATTTWQSCRVEFNKKGDLIATSSTTVSVWSTATGARVAQDPIVLEWYTQPVAFSPNGLHLAIGRQTQQVALLDLRHPSNVDVDSSSGTIRAPSWRLGGETRAVAFSPDGDHLISAAGSTIRLWQVEHGTTVVQTASTFSGHEANVVGLVALADGGSFASVDSQGILKVWAMEGRPAVWRATMPLPSTVALPLGDRITTAAVSADDGLYVRSLANRHEPLRRISGPYTQGLTNTIPLMVDDTHFIAIDPNGALRFFSADHRNQTATQVSENMERPCVAASSGLSAVALAPDSQLFAYANTECVVVLRLPDLHAIATANFPGPVHSLAFGQKDILLVAFSKGNVAEPSGTVQAWDWRSKQILSTAPVPLMVRPGVAVSADGTRVALFSRLNPTVSILNGDLTRELGRIPVGDSLGVALGGNGLRLATVHDDGSIRIWDTNQAQQLLILKHPGALPSMIRFAADGRLIGYERGAVTIWETERRGR